MKQGLLATAVFVGPVMMSAGLSWATEGLRAQLTIGQSIQQTDREGVTTRQDEGLISRTDLGFRLTSETRTQLLDFTTNTGLSYNFSETGGADRFQFEDPNAQLVYQLENRNSLLGFTASYQRSDLDETAFLDDDGNIETGAGRRETYGLVSTLALGRESRTRFDLEHTWRETGYSGTSDPSLVDITTQGLEGRLTFAISQTASVNVFASYRDVDAAGPGSTDRRTERVGIGASYEINPVTTATAEISYDEVSSDDNAGTTTARSGVGYKFGLTRRVANGSVSVNFSEEETINGRKRDLTFGRALELQRGSLSGSLGVTKTDGLEAALLASLSANLELDKRSTLRATLDRSSAISDDAETTVNTRFGLTYARELTALSRMTAGLQIADRNALSPGGQDQTSMRLNLSHRYEVGRDWELVSGLTYSKTRRDAQPDRSTSTISIGLEKTFDFRP